eukprot:m.20411 g.20411  ORF g.20411 m.20411 type:complete len:647 (+) comp28012_c0_seq1:36-1976(+)
MAQPQDSESTLLRLNVYKAAEKGSASILKLQVAKARQLLASDLFPWLFRSFNVGEGRVCAPLVISAKNNHLSVVKYLIKECGVDIEATGTVRFTGDRDDIAGAPPLWTAATAGHVEIVKFLVESGADIHHATSTDSTPLRGACFDGHLGIVRFLREHGASVNAANNSGQTPIMVAAGRGHERVVRYLLKQDVDLRLKTKEGYSVLHIVASAENSTVEIYKLLEEAGATGEITPDGWATGFLAATAGHKPIVDYIIAKGIVSSKQQAEMLELYGSVIFDKNAQQHVALLAWSNAMGIRIKHGLLLKPDEIISPLPAYDNIQEAVSPAELASLAEDTSRLEMHSLLVRERVIGKRRSTAYYIRRRGLKYAALGLFQRTVDLWTRALEMHREIIKPNDPDVKAILVNCVHTFKEMIFNGFVPTVHCFFAWGLEEMLKATPKSSHQTKLLTILLNFISVWMGLDYEEYSEDWQSRMSLIYRFTQSGVIAADESSPLHLACKSTTSQGLGYVLCRTPCHKLVKVLLQCSAKCNTTDADMNTPLLVLVMSMVNDVMPDSRKEDASVCSIVDMLMEAGTCVNSRNASKKKAIDLIFDKGFDVLCGSFPLSTENILKSSRSGISLQALAACSVVDNNLETTALSAKLKTFVSLH